MSLPNHLCNAGPRHRVTPNSETRRTAVRFGLAARNFVCVDNFVWLRRVMRQRFPGPNTACCFRPANEVVPG
jgi:hypothetical protein